MPSTLPIRLGTRGSALALWQAECVAELLRARQHVIEIVEIQTLGDVESRKPVASFAGEGVFAKEIRLALVASEIDLAVHSMKDVPTESYEGLAIAAVPCRTDSADALVCGGKLRGQQLAELPPGARIGTSSVRRTAQLLRRRPDVKPQPIRGNVDTRLRKLDACDYDALILAVAGLERLGLADRICQRFNPCNILPAAGQGALAVECRCDDAKMIEFAKQIDNRQVHQAVLAERELLEMLGAGCSSPVGALAENDGDTITLQAEVLSVDGTTRLFAEESGSAVHPQKLGQHVAELLMHQGAADLIH